MNNVYTQYKYATSKRNRTEGIENPLIYDLCVDQCIYFAVVCVRDAIQIFGIRTYTLYMAQFS